MRVVGKRRSTRSQISGPECGRGYQSGSRRRTALRQRRLSSRVLDFGGPPKGVYHLPGDSIERLPVGRVR